MDFRSRILKAGVVGVASLLPLIGNATALYRYTYHGAPEYEIMTPGLPDGIGTISGYFDFSAPLVAGLNQALAPTSYFFTDGVTTFTEQSGYRLAGYSQLKLTESGTVESYQFLLEYQVVGVAESHRHISIGANDYQEFTTYCLELCTAENFQSDGYIAMTTGFQSAGIASPYWTTSVVPIPAAVWLFGSSLGMLGWLRRK